MRDSIKKWSEIREIDAKELDQRDHPIIIFCSFQLMQRLHLGACLWSQLWKRCITDNSIPEKVMSKIFIIKNPIISFQPNAPNNEQHAVIVLCHKILSYLDNLKPQKFIRNNSSDSLGRTQFKNLTMDDHILDLLSFEASSRKKDEVPKFLFSDCKITKKTI